MDIVVAHGTGISILSLKDGKLEAVNGSPINLGNDVYAVALGDMNGDLVAVTIDSVTVLLANERMSALPPGFTISSGTWRLQIDCR